MRVDKVVKAELLFIYNHFIYDVTYLNVLHHFKIVLSKMFNDWKTYYLGQLIIHRVVNLGNGLWTQKFESFSSKLLKNKNSNAQFYDGNIGFFQWPKIICWHPPNSSFSMKKNQYAFKLNGLWPPNSLIRQKNIYIILFSIRLLVSQFFFMPCIFGFLAPN